MLGPARDFSDNFVPRIPVCCDWWGITVVANSTLIPYTTVTDSILSQKNRTIAKGPEYMITELKYSYRFL